MKSADLLEKVLKLAVLTDGMDSVIKYLAHTLVILCRVKGDKSLTITFQFGEKVTIEPNDEPTGEMQ